MSDVLTPDRVDAVARACVYRDDEIGPDHAMPEGAVVVQAIMSTFGFHPGRLAAHADKIRAMLAELPEQFHEGWSFLNGCTTRTGELWTGMQPTVEVLFALGQAIGEVRCVFPREVWPILPGGVPYYIVKGSGGPAWDAAAPGADGAT